MLPSMELRSCDSGNITGIRKPTLLFQSLLLSPFPVEISAPSLSNLICRNALVLDGSESLASAGERMRHAKMKTALVVRDHQLAGLVDGPNPDWEVCRHGHDPADIQVGDNLAGPISFCFDDDECLSAMHTMERHGLHCLPVANHNLSVIGVINLEDVTAHLRNEVPRSEEDEERTCQCDRFGNALEEDRELPCVRCGALTVDDEKWTVVTERHLSA